MASAKPLPTIDLVQMRKDFQRDNDAVAAKYRECIADIEFAFVPGKQWDEDMVKKRAGRPQYEFNKTRPVVKSITNDMRQNDPSIKVIALEDGRKKGAELMNGLIKSIEAQSRASVAYDTGGFFAAAGGYGVIGVDTEYVADDVFDQDIRVKEKRNPFAVLFDSEALEFDKRDGRRAFEVESYSREGFKARFPGKDACDFPTERAAYGQWFEGDKVRVVRYWCKHRDTKTIYQLSDGRVLDQDDYDAIKDLLDKPGPNGEPPLELKQQRDVPYDRITVSLCSGKEVLEGPTEWAGKFIPLVPVWGEAVNVDGKEYFAGVTRPIKDSQRLFNWDVCTGQEVMANQPRAPYLYTAAMIEGYEDEWKKLATGNPPGLPYNPGPNGEKPTREQPPAYPGGFFDSARFAADLIKSVSNVVDAPIQSRASSGKAIQAVEHQMDVGNFDFIDNLARAKQFVGEILVDLAPKIYDTERQILILGEDGKESYETINQTVIDPATGQPHIINDLSQGKYAVTVTVGPNYASQRMETVEALKQMASGPNPQLNLLAFYGIVKNMDAPGLGEFEAALRKACVSAGLIEAGEGEQPPQAQQPNPKDLADAKLKDAQAQKAAAEAAKTKVETAQIVQHAPAIAIEHAARAEAAVTDAYTKDPTTSYFGPPRPEPSRGLPPQQ